MGSAEPFVKAADEPIDSVTLDVYGEYTDPVEGVNESHCIHPVCEVRYLSHPLPVPAQPRNVIDRDSRGLLVDRPLPRLEGDDSVAPPEDHDLLQEPSFAHSPPEQDVAGKVEVAYDDILPLREVERGGQ